MSNGRTGLIHRDESVRRDGEDGKAIVDSAARALHGADGRVGLVGCSYPGALAMTDAAHVGPSSPLKVVAAGCNALVPQNRETFMLGGLMTYNMFGIASSLTHLAGTTPPAAASGRGRAVDRRPGAGSPTEGGGPGDRDHTPAPA